MFEMFSRLWAMLTVWLRTAEVAGESVLDLAETGKVQTSLVRGRAQLKAAAELDQLNKELESTT